jgi:glutaredoxin 3
MNATAFTAGAAVTRPALPRSTFTKTSASPTVAPSLITRPTPNARAVTCAAGNFFTEAKKALSRMQAGDYDAAAINATIDSYINANTVMMFSFLRCPFCLKAKALLTEQGVPFKVIEVDQMGPEGMAIRAELGNRTGRTSMPSIWIKGECIGGFNDGSPGLNPLNQSGKLLSMVK